ncbi:hypothetical protein ACFQ07_31500 [Actinomadura adrarensis]|uniref:Uncharacterized protein n=1 Tax=Actinomadura adrarensis TaxID=1819600 RepID=A0ABW3CS96_9ACTN
MIEDASDRAVAWALGLRDDSPLIPVTDILLVGPQRGLPSDEVLGRLFAVPAFTEQVRSEDRRWHSSTGLALVALAFELGYSQVVTRAGKAVRMTPEMAALLESQSRLFKEKFGRPPAPDEPIFFDPDADTPQFPSLVDIEQGHVALLEQMGVAPAWIYAHQQTDGLLPRRDGTFLTDRDAQEWHEAVDRYVRLHGGEEPDWDSNLQRINTILVLIDLQTATSDPEYAATLLRRLADDQGAEDLLHVSLTQMAHT